MCGCNQGSTCANSTSVQHHLEHMPLSVHHSGHSSTVSPSRCTVNDIEPIHACVRLNAAYKFPPKNIQDVSHVASMCTQRMSREDMAINAPDHVTSRSEPCQVTKNTRGWDCVVGSAHEQRMLPWWHATDSNRAQLSINRLERLAH